MSHAVHKNLKQTVPRRSRDHMLEETQEFLSRNLSTSAQSYQPGYRSDDDKAHHPHRKRKDRRRIVASEDLPKNGAATNGILISVPSNEHGHVDREHLAALVDRLFPLARPRRRDNVLLDLTNVRSVTSTFVKVAEAFRRHLALQDRSVFLYDIKRSGGRVLRMSELAHLVQRPNTVHEFENLFAQQVLPAFLAKVFE